MPAFASPKVILEFMMLRGGSTVLYVSVTVSAAKRQHDFSLISSRLALSTRRAAALS
jgi:hypothetical protein